MGHDLDVIPRRRTLGWHRDDIGNRPHRGIGTVPVFRRGHMAATVPCSIVLHTWR
jgi:hypothetical protein